MDQPQASAARPAAKWLAFSIAVNLFLAGIVIGSWAMRPWRDMPPPPRPPLHMMVNEASGKLSPEGLKKLSALADELEDRFRGGMSESRALRAKIREEMLREPFDPAAFTRALDALNASFAQHRAEGNRRFAEVIAAMSAEDRRQLATVRFP